ncbi:MAG TPA: hypothetical protein VMM14_08595 [Acidimicrobiia bacterium]|nr:hypothetical protein [Acidimicrobiia bacterium]
MVAVDRWLRDNEFVDTAVDPKEMARELLDSADIDWLRQLVDALDREVRTEPLDRLRSLWNLSNAGVARIFGISRQAYSKWLVSGPPADRADDIAAVDSITTLLDRYVKRERIAAVVRRSSPRLGDRSIIDRLESGDFRQTASIVADSFDLRRIQP